MQHNSLWTTDKNPFSHSGDSSLRQATPRTVGNDGLPNARATNFRPPANDSITSNSLVDGFQQRVKSQTLDAKLCWAKIEEEIRDWQENRRAELDEWRRESEQIERERRKEDNVRMNAMSERCFDKYTVNQQALTTPHKGHLQASGVTSFQPMATREEKQEVGQMHDLFDSFHGESKSKDPQTPAPVPFPVQSTACQTTFEELRTINQSIPSNFVFQPMDQSLQADSNVGQSGLLLKTGCRSEDPNLSSRGDRCGTDGCQQLNKLPASRRHPPPPMLPQFSVSEEDVSSLAWEDNLVRATFNHEGSEEQDETNQPQPSTERYHLSPQEKCRQTFLDIAPHHQQSAKRPPATSINAKEALQLHCSGFPNPTGTKEGGRGNRTGQFPANHMRTSVNPHRNLGMPLGCDKIAQPNKDKMCQMGVREEVMALPMTSLGNSLAATYPEAERSGCPVCSSYGQTSSSATALPTSVPAGKQKKDPHLLHVQKHPHDMMASSDKSTTESINQVTVHNVTSSMVDVDRPRQPCQQTDMEMDSDLIQVELQDFTDRQTSLKPDCEQGVKQCRVEVVAGCPRNILVETKRRQQPVSPPTDVESGLPCPATGNQANTADSYQEYNASDNLVVASADDPLLNSGVVSGMAPKTQPSDECFKQNQQASRGHLGGNNRLQCGLVKIAVGYPSLTQVKTDVWLSPTICLPCPSSSWYTTSCSICRDHQKATTNRRPTTSHLVAQVETAAQAICLSKWPVGCLTSTSSSATVMTSATHNCQEAMAGLQAGRSQLDEVSSLSKPTGCAERSIVLHVEHSTSWSLADEDRSRKASVILRPCNSTSDIEKVEAPRLKLWNATKTGLGNEGESECSQCSGESSVPYQAFPHFKTLPKVKMKLQLKDLHFLTTSCCETRPLHLHWPQPWITDFLEPRSDCHGMQVLSKRTCGVHDSISSKIARAQVLDCHGIQVLSMGHCGVHDLVSHGIASLDAKSKEEHPGTEKSSNQRYPTCFAEGVETHFSRTVWLFIRYLFLKQPPKRGWTQMGGRIFVHGCHVDRPPPHK